MFDFFFCVVDFKNVGYLGDVCGFLFFNWFFFKGLVFLLWFGFRLLYIFYFFY